MATTVSCHRQYLGGGLRHALCNMQSSHHRCRCRRFLSEPHWGLDLTLPLARHQGRDQSQPLALLWTWTRVEAAKHLLETLTFPRPAGFHKENSGLLGQEGPASKVQRMGRTWGKPLSPGSQRKESKGQKPAEATWLCMINLGDWRQ